MLLCLVSPTLVHTQPFLSLVLACLKGQEDQREALLSSIHRQLTQLLAAPAEVCKLCILTQRFLTPSITGIIFVQLFAQQMLHCKLRLFGARIATSTHNKKFAESRRDVYFLQQENLLRKDVVIRATDCLNLQRDTVRDKFHENVARITWLLGDFVHFLRRN